MMQMVRTTVTLDKDVERMLRESMHRSRRGFKETLNAALREALGRKFKKSFRSAFKIKARPMGLRPGIDPASFNKLADELEAEAVLNKANKSR